MMMELERFNTFDGIRVRPIYDKDRHLFHHCAGDSSVNERDVRKIFELLRFHGVGGINVRSDNLPSMRVETDWL